MIQENRFEPLKVLHMIDHITLLRWVFLQPDKLRRYRHQVGDAAIYRVGSWLSATLIWFPILVLLVAITAERIPVDITHQRSILALLMVVAGGWLLTGLIGQRDPRVDEKLNNRGFGGVFNIAILFAFGLAAGSGLAVALISALDLTGLLIVAQLGKANIVLLAAIFGVLFGIGTVIADSISWGMAGLSPVAGFLVALAVLFTPGVAGVFMAIYLVVFCAIFIPVFVLTLVVVLGTGLGDRLERGTASKWERFIRYVGLVLYSVAHLANVYIVLLSGWHLLA